MNFLVIDDDSYKLEKICDEIRDCDTIVPATTVVDAMAKYMEEEKSIDCVITDMQFPFDSNDRKIDIEAGLFILHELRRKGFKGKIILCTSSSKEEIAKLEKAKEFDYIIYYDCFVSLRSDFEKIYELLGGKSE